ncbi:MAG TPA: 2OG-Fe(II) oxygenase [Acidobacteriota bacterium]|nr:2OG-Fe(II) oxygenase [Acidobacteriota bacterium]HMZ79685.1 2OG-Fe(II) oxygenase [Acidobacteriota bacterium]HNB71570.1 2OG-Fe(II) oxygenase [Acidobacteriota bacterium]HND20915.1 2OG-Fe(II) oxygenase [Acidobacteriota bacterium]HNG93068.1 2OG-Fe(II) oxygenase [Acidobacteriota bacterium]
MKQYSFLNSDRLQQIHLTTMRGQQPCPWVLFHQLITPDGFEQLCQDFPSLDWFEKHQDQPRKSNQRPHNRYYLAYQQSFFSYQKARTSAFIKHSQLALSWQTLIEELQQPQYLQFLTHFFGTSAFQLQFSWHIGLTGSEVSPHCDWVGKLGTHLFYFNTSQEWSESWGGELIFLSNKQTDVPNPDFEDFETHQALPFLDNRSTLFQNNPSAWHGVRPLTCPEGNYRRLFNVIATRLSRPERLLQQVQRLIPGRG